MTYKEKYNDIYLSLLKDINQIVNNKGKYYKGFNAVKINEIHIIAISGYGFIFAIGNDCVFDVYGNQLHYSAINLIDLCEIVDKLKQ